MKSYDEFEVYILTSSGVRAEDRTATVEKDENGYTVITLKKDDKTTYYEVVRTERSDEKPSFGSYRDAAGEYEEAIEAVKAYMPAKTETLFRTEEKVENGDFIGAVVKASGLTGGNRAYADANSYHWAYEQFKTAREYGLVDGLQIKAYDKLNYKAAYFALYKAITAKGVKVNENSALLKGADLSAWSEEEKTMLAALVSVKIVSTEELEKINPTDTITRGEAARYIYRLTAVKDASDEPIDGGSNIGLILGITIPVAVITIGAAVAGVVIVRKKKSKSK